MAPILQFSVPNLKLGLAFDNLSVLLVQLDDVGVPWPLVDVLEEGRDGILLALGFALDLEQYCQFIIFSFGLSFIFCLSFLYYRMA
jgi:hypothetical protein